MTLTVNVHKAKTHLSKLPEQAHAGEEIILAKAGKPYARLMPLASKPSRRQPGGLAGYGGQGGKLSPAPTLQTLASPLKVVTGALNTAAVLPSVRSTLSRNA